MATIASITLWNILKSKCKACLSGEESRPRETITALWYDLVTNIRAQYEELQGSSDTMEAMKLSFQHSWSERQRDLPSRGARRHEDSNTSSMECCRVGRPPVRKRSLNVLLCGKNLRMGDVNQHNTHRERERGTKSYNSIIKNMCNSYKMNNNHLYKRLQSHFI